MNAATVQRNDKVIEQMERLSGVFDKLTNTKPGQEAVSRYEVSEVREAVSRLAKTIQTDAVEVPF